MPRPGRNQSARNRANNAQQEPPQLPPQEPRGENTDGGTTLLNNEEVQNELHRLRGECSCQFLSESYSLIQSS